MTSTLDQAKDKAARLLRKASVASSAATGSSKQFNKRRGSVSTTISAADDPSQMVHPVRPLVSYQNSYQLAPARVFPTGQVEHIMSEVINSYLQNETYQPELCRRMTKDLSEVIRSHVKKLMLPRYKIICLMHIGQLASQTVAVSSRCLWNSTTDNFATYQFKNNSLFAVCTVYAVYLD